MWGSCWRDMRRKCIHGPERADKCIDEVGYCEEAKKWPNVRRQIEKLEKSMKDAELS